VQKRDLPADTDTVEFEFAHLLDAVGAVQPHHAQPPAFQSPASEFTRSSPPLPTERGTQLTVDDLNGLDSDGDLIGQLLPWLDEAVPAPAAPAPAAPVREEAPSDEPDDDSVDSLLAELIETGPHPIVMPELETLGQEAKSPSIADGPAPVEAPFVESTPLTAAPVVEPVRQVAPTVEVPTRLPSEPARLPVEPARVVPEPAQATQDTSALAAQPEEAPVVRSRLADRGLSEDLLPARDRRRRR
jgi:hypothetical protein